MDGSVMQSYRCTVDRRDMLRVEDGFDTLRNPDKTDLEFNISAGKRHEKFSVWLNVEDVKRLHNHLANVLDQYHERGDSADQSGRPQIER